MKRLGIVAVGLTLVLSLTACTRTVERVVVVTATASAPSPTPQPSPTPMPNLSMEEAIGLVQQRKTTTLFPTGPEEATWKEKAFPACVMAVDPREYSSFFEAIDRGESVRAPRGLRPSFWTATMDRPGRWRVQLVCPPEEGPPVTGAAWTVNDETQQVIPVAGLAD